MTKIKIRFMKRDPFLVGFISFWTFLMFPIFVYAIISYEFELSILILLLIFLMFFGCFFSDIYGIRLNDKYIVFKDGRLRRKYLLEDIKNIEVWFIKMKKHYKVSMKVNFNYTYNKIRFEWDEIYIGKRGFVKTRINDSNIGEYISLFKDLDKFYVYPVKLKYIK